MGTLDANALIAQAQQAAASLPVPTQTEIADAQLRVDTILDLGNPFNEGSLPLGQAADLAGNVVSATQQAREGTGLEFGEFVEAPNFNFLGLESSLAQRLGQGVAQGKQSALGSLARRGLLGSGAEAGVQQRAGESLGRGAIDIRERLALKQLNFETLKAQRKTKFNEAEALFNAGQVEAAQQLLFQYDALTAELTSRQQEGGSTVGTIVGGAAGFLAGGPEGGLVGAQIGSTL